MPSLSDVAQNAKKIKEQIAEHAGVAPKDVNDKNLAEAGKALEGSGIALKKGVDPTKVSIDELKAPVSDKEDKSSASDLSKQEKIAYAIAAIAPTLVGYAAGGLRGGQVGAQASQGAVNQMDADFKARNAMAKADKEKADALARQKTEADEKEKVRVSERKEDMKMKSDELAIKRREAEARIKALQQKGEAKTKAAGLTLSAGEKALDQKFAKEYSDFVAGGGYADIQKNLEQLQGVSAKLNDPNAPNVTGSILGRLPFQDVINAEGVNMKEQVEEVIQRNLRLILGAQFTEKEGAALIARAYNPKLDEKTNADRLNRLVGQMQKAAEAKLAAAQYFEENGTLKGYQGTANISFNDLKESIDGKKQIKSGLNNPMLNEAQADSAPDFDNMSEDELKKYLGE